MPPSQETAAANLHLAQRKDFRTELDNEPVDLYTLEAPGGVTAQVTNYGARVVNLFVPDRDGRLGNVVLGFRSLTKYIEATDRYYGATIGRFANRIGKGQIRLDGVTYELAKNEHGNHLHGGFNGFDRAVWSARRINEGTIVFRHASRHLDEGFPGALTARVTFSLTRDLALRIRYEATTNAPTFINLTNHSYFNLTGEGPGDIGNHALQILADEYTPTDGELIPTGEIAAVKGTPLDFRTPQQIGARIDQNFPQLILAGGYDHNWVLRPASGPLRAAARVYEPTSGRTMEVLTTEPGLQFYSGNHFDGSDIADTGKAHGHRCAFALETQHFPDSPNHGHFPSTVLRPGETFRSQTVYRFLTVG